MWEAPAQVRSGGAPRLDCILYSGRDIEKNEFRRGEICTKEKRTYSKHAIPSRPRSRCAFYMPVSREVGPGALQAMIAITMCAFSMCVLNGLTSAWTCLVM